MQQMGTMGTKSRTVYILLAIFLGSFGVHNFYAGYVWRGMSQLLLTLLTFCLLAPVSFVWAIVEACVVKKDAQGKDFC